MSSKSFTKIDFKLLSALPKSTKASVKEATTVLRFAHQLPKAGESIKKQDRDALAASKMALASVERVQPGFADFLGQSGQCHVAYSKKDHQRCITVGLGPFTTANSSPKTLRAACGTAVKVLKSLKVEKVVVVMPQLLSPKVEVGLTESYHMVGGMCPVSQEENAARPDMVASVAQWFEERNYKQMNYFGVDKKTKKPLSSTEHFIKEIALVTNSGTKTDVLKGASVGRATNAAKFLGNTRPDLGSPAFYAKWAESLVKQHKGSIKLRHNIVGSDLRKQGLNLHWNVGMGSVFKPHLVVLEYVGAPKQTHSTALVGKGVTFDTGGLHVKPYGSMEQMHLDMCGAAAVLGTMQTIAEQKLKVNVTAVLGLAENAIGSHAYRPSSILTSLKGSTVEILNTDAEGRLVLADALTFVQDKAKLAKKPTEIIDLATLTGAVLIALGSDRAAVFSNDNRLRSELYNSGVQSQEPLWPLPIAPEHVAKMKGDMSDLKNIGGGREGGSATAAAFLQHFVNKGTPWAHLDIAGTAMNTSLNGTQKGGASGYGVAMLTHYLTNKQKK